MWTRAELDYVDNKLKSLGLTENQIMASFGWINFNSIKEISRSMFICTSTCKFHLTKAYEKTKSKNSTGLIKHLFLIDSDGLVGMHLVFMQSRVPKRRHSFAINSSRVIIIIQTSLLNLFDNGPRFSRAQSSHQDNNPSR